MDNCHSDISLQTSTNHRMDFDFASSDETQIRYLFNTEINNDLTKMKNSIRDSNSTILRRNGEAIIREYHQEMNGFAGHIKCCFKTYKELGIIQIEKLKRNWTADIDTLNAFFNVSVLS